VRTDPYITNEDAPDLSIHNAADLEAAMDAGIDSTDLSARWADLRGADLSGLLLAGADLRGADLTGADLSEADLSGADLTDATLTGADLTDANLTGAVGVTS
jgi:uncharacterized protein YjbI with pentapeptide repeats